MTVFLNSLKIYKEFMKFLCKTKYQYIILNKSFEKKVDNLFKYTSLNGIQNEYKGSDLQVARRPDEGDYL